MKYSKYYTLLLLIFILFSTSAYSQKKKSTQLAQEKKELLTSATIQDLKLRLVGPGVISGRISDLAVDPNNHSIMYVAVASGGVWKTTNAGITFEPIFDDAGSFSIGCITMDPNNPHIIWVGTGENNSQRSVGYGDGIYKSLDDGKSWKNMGLKNSEHIGKIIVDPRNSNIIYAACQGPLWAKGGDRGLFKSTDGGNTWNAILKISDWTGVSDIAIDPRNPDIIYATSYQRARTVWTVIDGGPEGAIYKSNDAGKTWNKLTNGLPGGELGKIGIAVSPANPDYVYATIETSGAQNGIYLSTDRGESWEKRNSWISGSPQYYQEIICDPINPEKAYFMDTYTKYTTDGGKTLKNVGLKYRHVDDHSIWIDPKDTRHYIIGGDGGLYETYDDGIEWRFFANLPLGQFYRIQSDNKEPFYWVYGGTQDNSSWGGPSQTNSTGGITNDEWFQIVGGDGYEAQIDPTDPNIVYGEFQYGGVVRMDRRNGELKFIQPQPKKGEMQRFNWDTPLLISRYDPKTIYIASNILWKSTDRGDSWTQISPDLTRQMDRNKLKIMDKIWNADAIAKSASTSLYGNIVSLCESPLNPNLLFVGTDDGLIQITEDGGKNWTKIEKVGGLPELIYVSDIFASNFNDNVVYATYDNHKMGDFKPYVFKSNDKGKTWTSISSNLPERGTVYTIAEDFVDPNLLFVGTEFGLFFTNDGGNKWIQLKGNFPTINVRDLDIQQRETDLIVGTFGRGIYILDNYSPLRNLVNENLEKEAFIFPVKDAKMYVMDESKAKYTQGGSFYRADNPPFGATFTYYLKESIKTQKEKRNELENEASKKGEEAPYPTLEQLTKEDLEESPYLLFSIYDQNNQLVRNLTASATAGIHRISWDLRYPDLSPAKKNTDINKNSGFPVLPGRYKVIMSKVINGNATEIAGPVEFDVKHLDNATLPIANRTELVTFQKNVAKLQQAVMGTQSYYDKLLEQIELMKKAILSTPNIDTKLYSQLRQAEIDLKMLGITLNGNRTIEAHNENQTPSINDRLNYVIWVVWDLDSAPTQTAKDSYNIASDQLKEFLQKMKSLEENQIKPVQDTLQKFGAPWTPGRFPVWE
ncbi:MAG TPA: glycosyl hydrolase [Bacteroidota bacterium]|nr:glycosyl hydrolase [Bacteroidota bacterium]